MINLLKSERTKLKTTIYDIPTIPVNINDCSSWCDDNYTIILSDNLKELKDLMNNNSTTGTICPGSKIYFAPDSYISPLYLSKLKTYNIDIKRVLKPEKADIIVTSKYQNDRDYYFLTSKYNNDRRVSYNFYSNDEKNAKEQLEQIFQIPFYYAIKASSARIAQKYYLMHQYPDKIVHDMDFIKYVFQFFPVIDDATFTNALDMLKSTDKNTRDIGTNCLQYYNFGNHIYDLINHYLNRTSALCVNESQMSQSEKYMSAALDIDLSYHSYYGIYTLYKKSVNLVIQNPLNTQSMDDIAQKIVDRYLYEIETEYSLQQIRESLKLIGYTLKLEKLPDDQNGKTESGD